MRVAIPRFTTGLPGPGRKPPSPRRLERCQSRFEFAQHHHVGPCLHEPRQPLGLARQEVAIGNRLDDLALLELAPDRVSDLIVPELDRVIARCRSEEATLVLVDFSYEFGWRRHGPLWDRLGSADVPYESLDPIALVIDGAEFEPVKHFRTWRQIERVHAETKPQREAALAAAIDRLASEHATHASLAEALNADELFTPNGKPWTADNLRKFIKAL